MRDEEAMTLDEISLATGHPKSSIKATISQARKTMNGPLRKDAKMNREYRKTLIEKYLNAESSLEEERMLAEWFSVHKAESDEESVSKILLAEYPEATCNNAVKEFNAIVATAGRRSHIMKWTFSIAAAAAIVIGLGIFFAKEKTCDFNGLEIAQGIEQIMLLNMDNVESITARPKCNNVIITALMNDGSTCSYLMSKDAGTSSVSITAMNK